MHSLVLAFSQHLVNILTSLGIVYFWMSLFMAWTSMLLLASKTFNSFMTHVMLPILASILDQLNDGVVEGILVLLQPSGQVVGHGGGVVDDGKVRVRVGAGVGLGELSPSSPRPPMPPSPRS